jgi:hypothetical protein
MCNDVVVPLCKAAPNRVTMRTPVDSFAGYAGLAVSVVGVARMSRINLLRRADVLSTAVETEPAAN